MNSSQQMVDTETVAQRLRRSVITMTSAANSGHPTSSLSAADIMAVLYGRILRYRPEQPDWPERDRFLLCKGHAAPILYATLAEFGYFSTDLLPTLRKFGSPLQGHPDMLQLPGVEASTGSLGQGLSICNGMAMGMRLDDHPGRVYALLGDGEIQEGQVWEAAMAAAHFKLDRLTAIIDLNGLETDGTIWEIMSPAPVADKWRAFGWHVQEVNGHDHDELLHALETAKTIEGQPSLILAHTVKGKGVSFLENALGWHGKALNQELLEKALAELDAAELEAGGKR